ncbi:Uncharacterized protein DAT39_015920 [Clarias magur]|uniref:Uncharacterized protein n=1 Tax=Clarias magur TaxID=1594786 RepID=A0A8J4TU01_CLAMG|nr:Uncharacterized protein DAT39_015920 [Clarias magur]
MRLRQPGDGAALRSDVSASRSETEEHVAPRFKGRLLSSAPFLSVPLISSVSLSFLLSDLTHSTRCMTDRSRTREEQIKPRDSSHVTER